MSPCPRRVAHRPLCPTLTLSLPLSRTQRISYAKSTSHATVGQTEGPEAVYAIKLGLRDVDGAKANGSKLTVSGAQKKLSDDKREKRARDNEEEEEEEDSDEDGPERKKGRQEEEDGDGAPFSFSPCGRWQREREDKADHARVALPCADAMMEESDDEDAPGPAPAAAGDGSGPTPSLQVQGLPAEVTTDMLTALFQQCVSPSAVSLCPRPLTRRLVPPH